MAFIFLPIIALAFAMGLITLEHVRGGQHIPSPAVSRSLYNSQEFISYRNAVTIFLQNNPAFLGTVPPSSLNQFGHTFNPEFLSLVQNSITQRNPFGRLIICHAALPSGAISEALQRDRNDMSLGIAQGQNVINPNFGIVTHLENFIPDGNIVSIIYIGN